jgi:hypothetical protein
LEGDFGEKDAAGASSEGVELAVVHHRVALVDVRVDADQVVRVEELDHVALVATVGRACNHVAQAVVPLRQHLSGRAALEGGHFSGAHLIQEDGYDLGDCEVLAGEGGELRV